MSAVGSAFRLAPPDARLFLLRYEHRLLHRLRLGRLLPALGVGHPPHPLQSLHHSHGLQPSADGLDGQLEMLVSRHSITSFLIILSLLSKLYIT